jgi:hypothetical protein
MTGVGEGMSFQEKWQKTGVMKMGLFDGFVTSWKLSEAAVIVQGLLERQPGAQTIKEGPARFAHTLVQSEFDGNQDLYSGNKGGRPSKYVLAACSLRGGVESNAEDKLIRCTLLLCLGNLMMYIAGNASKEKFSLNDMRLLDDISLYIEAQFRQQANVEKSNDYGASDGRDNNQDECLVGDGAGDELMESNSQKSSQLSVCDMWCGFEGEFKEVSEAARSISLAYEASVGVKRNGDVFMLDISDDLKNRMYSDFCEMNKEDNEYNNFYEDEIDSDSECNYGDLVGSYAGCHDEDGSDIGFYQSEIFDAMSENSGWEEGYDYIAPPREFDINSLSVGLYEQDDPDLDDEDA